MELQITLHDSVTMTFEFSLKSCDRKLVSELNLDTCWGRGFKEDAYQQQNKQLLSHMQYICIYIYIYI